ncbi:EPIDERMAL PATTERNING FACTOR-like protein 6 isoform X2 [Diospyros lotus]|uniref:EPIDERMAL PATTERNING FACTOR-like protein 6 isoform X2 n=1 Tax=Diospyros lotus TaxID=55363 RepID=UPI002251E5D1|nr:EPIDERMAL PATTERNING FACTOR-like protein 6 isoform X2 [Diospyros lotus]
MERVKTGRLCRLVKKRSLIYCIAIFFFSAMTLASSIGWANPGSPCLDISRPSTPKDGLYIQEGIGIVSEILNGEAIIVSGDRKEVIPASLGGWTRRLLIGLGSSPPRCAAKCGKCTPCRPVHVPVPPGTPVTAEYYPEAWRCKCGNKLYMP